MIEVTNADGDDRQPRDDLHAITDLLGRFAAAEIPASTVSGAARELVARAPALCGALIDQLALTDGGQGLFLEGLLYHLRGNPDLDDAQWTHVETWLAASLSRALTGDIRDFDRNQTLDLIARLRHWRWKTAQPSRAGIRVLMLARALVSQGLALAFTAPRATTGNLQADARALYELGAAEDVARLAREMGSLLPDDDRDGLSEVAQAYGHTLVFGSMPDDGAQTFPEAPLESRLADAIAAGDHPAAFALLDEALAAGLAPDAINTLVRSWLEGEPGLLKAIFDRLAMADPDEGRHLDALLYRLRGRPEIGEGRWVQVERWLAAAFATELSGSGRFFDAQQAFDLVARLKTWRWGRGRPDARGARPLLLARQVALRALSLALTAQPSDAASAVFHARVLFDLDAGDALLSMVEGFGGSVTPETVQALTDLAARYGRTLVFPTSDGCDIAVKIVVEALERGLAAEAMEEVIRHQLAQTPACSGRLVDRLALADPDEGRFVLGFLDSLCTDAALTPRQWGQVERWLAARLLHAHRHGHIDDEGQDWPGEPITGPDLAAWTDLLPIASKPQETGEPRTLVFVSGEAFLRDPLVIGRHILGLPSATVVCDNRHVHRILAACLTVREEGLELVDPEFYDQTLDRDRIYEICAQMHPVVGADYAGRTLAGATGFEVGYDEFLSTFLDDFYVAVTGLVSARARLSGYFDRLVLIGDINAARLQLAGLTLVAGRVFHCLSRAESGTLTDQTAVDREVIAPEWQNDLKHADQRHAPMPASDNGQTEEAPSRPLPYRFHRRSFPGKRAQADNPTFFYPLRELELPASLRDATILFAETLSRPYAEALSIFLDHLEPERTLIIVAPYWPGGRDEIFNRMILDRAGAKTCGVGDDAARVRAAFPNLYFTYLNFPEDADATNFDAVLAHHAPALEFLTDRFSAQLAARFSPFLVSGAAEQIERLIRKAFLMAVYAREICGSLYEELGERLSSVATFSGRRPEARVAALIARAASIPVADWQVVLLGRTAVFLPIIADRVLAISEIAIDLYVSYLGVARENCRLIGFHRFSRAMRDYTPDTARLTLRAAGIAENAPFAIFAGQPLALEDQRHLYRGLSDAIRQTQIPVLICAHPTQRATGEVEFIRETIRALDNPLLIYSDDFSVYQLFPLASCTIAYSSNVLFEIGSLGLPAILFDPLPSQHVLDYQSCREISFARNTDDLAARMLDSRHAAGLEPIDFAAAESDMCARIRDGLFNWPDHQAARQEQLRIARQAHDAEWVVEITRLQATSTPSEHLQALLLRWQEGNHALSMRLAETIESMPEMPAGPLVDTFDRLWASGGKACAAHLAAPVIRAIPHDLVRVGQALHALRAGGRPETASALSQEITRQRPNNRYAAHFVGPLEHMNAYYDGGVSQGALPFVMLAPAAGMNNTVLRTDAAGFRYTQLADGTAFAPEDDPGRIGDAIVSGNSLVFGVGTTRDRYSIPSLLSGGRRYYNFGLRAGALAQNFMALSLELSRLPAIRDVIVIGGWIEFAGAHFLPIVPRNTGGYLGWSHLDRQLNPLLYSFPKEDWPATLAPHFTQPDLPAAERVALVARHIEAMIVAFSRLCIGQRARLTFVLQPIAEWIDREVPEAEAACAEALGDSPSQEAPLHAFSLAFHRVYAGLIKDACARHGVDFIDANALMEASPHRHAWLFAGRAHLTDDGSRLLANLLRERLAR